jgi:outer membrane protein, adhesin transport system
VKDKRRLLFALLAPLQIMPVYADSNASLNSFKQGVSKIFAPTPTAVNTIDLRTLSDFPIDTSRVEELPVVGRPLSTSNMTGTGAASSSSAMNIADQSRQIGFSEAILQAVQRRPEITQSLSQLAAQGANIDIAKSGYYPQISGGLGTADLTSGERGRQIISLEATQMLYDFGKTKSGVDIEKAKLEQKQAEVLVNIDDIAYQVANTIVNIKRYQDIVDIANQQIKGISRIAEIAELRAKAGISSQADPIQAQSNLEAAESNRIVQETQLIQFQQRLRTLLGYEVNGVNWQIPDVIVQKAGLYDEPQFNQIPTMLVAQTGIQIAKYQKQQSKLSYYPTINLKGNLSQAVNGRNPNNNEDNGFYNSIMLEASSNLYQGGAVGAQTRSASYAEEAAKAQVNTAYLDVLDQVRQMREEIANKQKQMQVLNARKETTIRTKELYQEQYKLGTRTVVDLLNAEQAIHSAAQEIEAARYDIYAAIVKYIQVTGRTRELYSLNNIAIQGFEIQP